MTLLRAVTAYGTGAAAAQLQHPMGGKTGTTSDYTDAWFLGFSPSVTCGVWVGYDSRESLGKKETGAKDALPIWMTVMRAAIAGKDDEQFLADEKENKLDEAAAKPPARPATVRPPKSNVPPAAQPNPVPPVSNAAKTAPQSNATAPLPAPPKASTNLVHPAMPAQASLARPSATIKPALASEAEPR
jgi:penicillin-binding protein 1A